MLTGNRQNPPSAKQYYRIPFASLTDRLSGTF